MLAIPIMRSEGPADISSLERILRNQQTFPDDQIVNDCRRFDAMRKEVVAVHDPNEITQSLLLQYFYQLKSLVPRLSSFENELQLNFHWADAFVTGRKCLSSSLQFEMAAVIWNLAAFDSMRGAKSDRSTDEGIRAAGKFFQQAAGYFDYLKEQLLPSLPQTIALQCLTNDCLNMVKHLMLAQGQLCFYEKAVRDKKREAMKTGIVAKLAAQTSSNYQVTAAACRTGVLGSILDISWFAITDFQAKCFRGAAEYWQALASKETALQKGSGYGEEVARYNRAEASIRQALEIGRKHNLTAALPAGAEALLNIILTNRTTAQKELSTIYMESVPNEGAIPEVIGVAMVKPSPLPDQSLVIPSLEVLFFKFILPRALVEAIQKFYSEIQAVIAQTSANSEMTTNIGRTTLASVGLPGALENIKTENSIPIPLWNKILKIQSMGGVERLKTLVMELTSASKRSATSIKLVEESIQTEEAKDQAFFLQYPPYHGTRSVVLAADIKKNLQLLKEAYQNAQTNDENITRELIAQTTEDQLLLLTKTREELLKLFPTVESLNQKKSPPPPPQPPVANTVADLLDFDHVEPSPPPPVTATTAVSKEESLLGPDGIALEGKLHELAELFEQRIKETERLKSFQSLNIHDAVQQTFLTTTTTIAEVGKGSGSGSIPAVQELLDRHLQEVHQARQAIENTFFHQEQLLAEILRLNDGFTKYKQSNPLVVEKNRFLQTLEENITRFFALHSQVSAGQTFYSNLQSKLTTLQQSIDDLSYTQQWQRQEFEKDQVEQHNRYEQEQRDHELAMKLANELNLQNSPPPSSHPGVATAAAVGVGAGVTMGMNPSYSNPTNPYVTSTNTTATTAAAVPSYAANNSYNYTPPVTAAVTPTPAVTAHNHPTTSSSGGVVYGTPVAGPPSNYQQYTPSGAVPPAPVTTATATNATTSNYNNYYSNPAATNISYATTSSTNHPPVASSNPVMYGNTSSGYATNPGVAAVPQPPATASTSYGAPTNYSYHPNPAMTTTTATATPGALPATTYYAGGAQPYTAQPYQQQQPVIHNPPGSIPGQPVQQPPPPVVQRNLTSVEMEAKVSRVMEMGFPRDQVYSALSQTGWNEEAAINVLLGGEVPPPPSHPTTGGMIPPPAVQGQPQAKPKTSGGGFFWGRK